MIEAKWTPGPWEYDCESDFIIDDNGDYICSVYIGYSCSEMEEKEANAHLIAAAPDLYDALEDAVQLLQMAGYSTVEHCTTLAKARGETQA